MTLAVTMVVLILQGIAVAQQPPAPPAAASTSPSVRSLHSAAREGDLVSVRALLSSGATDIDALSPEGYPPLVLAAAGRQTEIVRLLLIAGANPNAKSSKGFTPLMVVALDGDITLAEMLLRAGARPDSQNEDKVSAIAIARQQQNEELMKLLGAYDAELKAAEADRAAREKQEAAEREKEEEKNAALARQRQVEAQQAARQRLLGDWDVFAYEDKVSQKALVSFSSTEDGGVSAFLMYEIQRESGRLRGETFAAVVAVNVDGFDFSGSGAGFSVKNEYRRGVLETFANDGEMYYDETRDFSGTVTLRGKLDNGELSIQIEFGDEKSISGTLTR